jgi:hypothetical protein
VLIVHQQHVQGAEAVAKADKATAKSVQDLGDSRRFSFFVVMSEAKTSRVRMAPRTAGAAAIDWRGGRVQLTIFGTATSLRFG